MTKMDDNNLPDELWTSAEAASYLGMRLKRLISLAGQGRVPGSYKIGPGLHADWRFDADKIRAFKQMREERAARIATMMNIKDAAKFLKCNLETLRRLTREGQIQGIKDDDGSRAEWRFAKTDLVRFLVSRSESGDKEKGAAA
jgi:excisionase family DNA binding protein